MNKENGASLCISVDMDEESCNCGPLEDMQCSVDDQLELLCLNKSPLIIPSSKIIPDEEDEFEKDFRQLELEDRVPTSSLNLLQDKENRECGGSEGGYAFTPDTVEGSLNWPCTNRSVSNDIVYLLGLWANQLHVQTSRHCVTAH